MIQDMCRIPDDIELAALDTFAEGYNCAQAVLAACGPGLGLPRAQCLALAAGLGGGVCRAGELCGAVAGAVLAMGLRHGVATIDHPEAKGEVYVRIRPLLDAFAAEHGALTCRDLLGFALDTPDGQQLAAARDIHHAVCPAFVRTAARLVREHLPDHTETRHTP
jgi:C_GCAxxG_C_C family probable redox protein